MTEAREPAQGADIKGFLRGNRDPASQRRMSDVGRAAVPARTSFVTLAVRDLARMSKFYRQFGWPESKFSDDSFVAFRTAGAVLGLFPAHNYEREFGPVATGDGFKGFVLAINLENAARVDEVYSMVKDFDGIRLTGAPEDLSFGGRGFTFVDPEGNAWEVVWAEETSFDERGGLIFP